MNQPTQLQLTPVVADAFNRANRLYKDNKPTEALPLLDAALALYDGLEQAWLLKARCHVALGEHMPARAAFTRTLKLNAGNYSAWLEVGHLCRQMGDLPQSTVAYQKAIDIDRNRHEALLGMARVMVQLGHPEAAQRAWQDAMTAAKAAKEPVLKQRQVALMMGQYWMEAGHLHEALAAFDLALRLLPNDLVDERAEVLMDAAVCCLRLGQKERGQQLLTLATGARQLSTLMRLSSLSVKNGFPDEAVQVMKLATQQHPDSIEAWASLAHVHAECWQMDEALAAVQRLQDLGGHESVPAIKAYIAARLGDVEAAMSAYKALAAHEKNGHGYASSMAMSALYSDRLSAPEVSALHRELFADMGAGARARESFVREPLAGRRVRLGMVSPDFHMQHPVNIFMQPVLRELDRSRFELFLYFTGNAQDEQTALARSRVEHWVEAASFNDVQLAKRIDSDRIDVMLDLSGHTNHNRLAMLAKRVAPVQLTYLGYPGSTGVPNIDAMLGDAVVTPPEDDGLCSEQVLRLPGTVFCYAPEEDYPLPDFGPSMADRPLTFGSFNNISKLTPHTLELWARVLQAVQGSRLLLKAPSFGDEGAIKLYRGRLEALGVDPQRLEFRGPVGLPLMMAEYADVDIGLDSVPYNGGTTTLQAMWMGVPVVVKHGQHFVSRMGASFMQAAGLAEWVAKDDDEYVAIAARMAADRLALLTLKKGLRARLQSLPAWNPVLHTRHVEDAILQACGVI
jgi:predicted O-linked N-acetylglucosamine transferase (SPINDLY family)